MSVTFRENRVTHSNVLMTLLSNASRNATVHQAATVLVVDDEELIRELVGMMLGALGYRVLSAENGAQAMELGRARGLEGIDVLITDMCMPGMSGAELAEEFRALRPGIKAIFISGYSSDEIESMGVDVREAACIAKPFQAHTIAKAVRTLLAGAPGLN
jgi:two-component system cell cycle sensor histidine kinase/response regulator CckA